MGQLEPEEAAAQEVVDGTSTEVKEAAKAEATRQGEDWGRLTWRRRKELIQTAATTVLQAKIGRQPASTQALVTQLRALEPVDAAAAKDTNPPFPKLGVSLALLHLFAAFVPKGATTAEACFNVFKTLT